MKKYVMSNLILGIIFSIVMQLGNNGLSAQDISLQAQDHNKKMAGVKEKISTLRKTAKALKALSGESIPGNLDKLQRKLFIEHMEWLERSADRLNALADKWEKEINSSTAQTTGFKEMTASLNSQFLLLQQQMQQESQRYTTLSNILKVRHDTAKNAIDNLR